MFKYVCCHNYIDLGFIVQSIKTWASFFHNSKLKSSKLWHLIIPFYPLITIVQTSTGILYCYGCTAQDQCQLRWQMGLSFHYSMVKLIWSHKPLISLQVLQGCKQLTQKIFCCEAKIEEVKSQHWIQSSCLAWAANTLPLSMTTSNQLTVL